MQPIARFPQIVAMALAVAGLLAAAFSGGDASARSRIKDLVDFGGVQGNDLLGYGLVVGLDGTGDSMRSSPYTEQALVGMLERLGINVDGENLGAKNVAAVLVTAELPDGSAGHLDSVRWVIDHRGHRGHRDQSPERGQRRSAFGPSTRGSGRTGVRG